MLGLVELRGEGAGDQECGAPTEAGGDQQPVPGQEAADACFDGQLQASTTNGGCLESPSAIFVFARTATALDWTAAFHAHFVSTRHCL